VTGLWAVRSGVGIPAGKRVSSPLCGPTNSSSASVGIRRALFLRVKWMGCEADHSSLNNVVVKNGWTYHLL